MLVCGSGWQKEEPRLSRDSSATRVFQTQEILHKSEMPWKGTSSLLSSLSITNSGSRLTLAQWWKGLKAVGLGEHFGWDLFRLYLLTQHYGVSMATGTCFSVLHVERLYFTCNKSSLVRKMWSCATSFLVVQVYSIVSQSPHFPCDMHGEKCPRPASKILKPRMPLETQENGVCSRDSWHGCGRSEIEALFLLSLGSWPWMGMEGHEMKRSFAYCPWWFCSKECSPWGTLGPMRTPCMSLAYLPSVMSVRGSFGKPESWFAQSMGSENHMQRESRLISLS